MEEREKKMAERRKRTGRGRVGSIGGRRTCKSYRAIVATTGTSMPNGRLPFLYTMQMYSSVYALVSELGRLNSWNYKLFL